MAAKVPGKGQAITSVKPTSDKPTVATSKIAATEAVVAAPAPAPVEAPATIEVPVVAKVAAPAPAPVVAEVVAKPVATPALAVIETTPAPLPPVIAAPKPEKIAAPLPKVVAPVVAKVSPTVADVVAPVVKSAPAALPPETKGMSVKARTIQPQPKAAAEKVKLMIADFNDRAKAAFEKTAKAGEELTEFTKGNMEALAASAKTAAKGAETLGQEMAEYGKKSFETASATMKTLATVKTPTEMFQIQSDYAKTTFDSAVAEASKLSEAWLKLAGDVFSPISNRYALAAEKIKSATL